MTDAQLLPFTQQEKATFNESKGTEKTDLGKYHVKIVWGHLLGKATHELQLLLLYNAPKLTLHIAKIREEFKKDHKNLRKFPKMNEANWK